MNTTGENTTPEIPAVTLGKVRVPTNHNSLWVSEGLADQLNLETDRESAVLTSQVRLRKSKQIASDLRRSCQTIQHLFNSFGHCNLIRG
jgi:hypothetical protein